METRKNRDGWRVRAARYEAQTVAGPDPRRGVHRRPRGGGIRAADALSRVRGWRPLDERASRRTGSRATSCSF
jgi:hypothetical protein